MGRVIFAFFGDDNACFVGILHNHVPCCSTGFLFMVSDTECVLFVLTVLQPTDATMDLNQKF